ncbi:MAG: FtsX-like permease family protein, partial [Dehalococcoidia bacterium]
KNRYSNVQLGQLSNEEGWHLMTGRLPRNIDVLIYREKFAEPALFHLISIFMSGGIYIPSSSSIDFDDLTVWGSDLPEEGVVFEGFENPQPWEPLPTGVIGDDSLTLSEEASRNGQTGLRFSVGREQGRYSRGFFIPSGPYPLPAIVGPNFEVGQQFTLRKGNSLVPVRVAETVRYFPTFNPDTQNIVIINLDHYLSFLRHLSSSQRVLPNEFWITPHPSINVDSFVSVLKNELPPFFDIDESHVAVEIALRDPLAAGAWQGLTLFSVAVLVGAVLLGLGLMGAISLRQARLDLSVARAIGFSKRQLMASLVAERVVMVVLAMLAGMGVGIALSRWTVGYLDITPTGRPILPPLLLGIDDDLLLVAGISLAVVALIAIGFTLVLAGRLRMAQELREFE